MRKKQILIVSLLTICSLLLSPYSSRAQDTIPEIVIDPLITRDAEIIPTGEANAICITNTGTPAPAFALCSTVNLTGKTVLYKIPEYTFASIPAGNPLVIVTNSSSAALCNGDGAIKAVCWHNGTAWVTLGGGGGVADPGSNGIAVRSALNTLIARSLATASSARIGITNADGVSGNPTLDTGSDVPLKSGANTFTSTNIFNSKLVVPRKAEPVDPNDLTIGEIFVDGELGKYRSSGGSVYTLLKIGDGTVRAFIKTTNPTSADDIDAGYYPGDLWINNQNTLTTPEDDTIWILINNTADNAQWLQMNALTGAIHADFINDDHTQYTLVTTFTGSVPVGGCTTDRHVFVKTDATPNAAELYGCSGAGATPVKSFANALGITQVAAQTGAFTPSAGGSPLAIHGENGNETREASGVIYVSPTTAARRRVCMLTVGDGTNTIVDADFSPFKANRCYIPYAATVVEITLQGDAGTPTVTVQRRRDSATLADLLSGALAGAGTTETCAMAGTGQTCINGTTSSGSITLSNTAITAGDWIEIKSGTGSTATSLSVGVVFTVN